MQHSEETKEKLRQYALAQPRGANGGFGSKGRHALTRMPNYQKERKRRQQQENPEIYERQLEASRKANREKTQKIRQFIWQYKNEHACIDCGETDPIVLEFDHRHRSEKLFGVAEFKSRSLKEVKAEIQKCDVRCANCHRRQTADERGWWSDFR